jgi:hypothetical protein
LFTTINIGLINGQTSYGTISETIPPTIETYSYVMSTELIDYSGFSTDDCARWASLCLAQTIPEFVVRVPAYDFITFNGTLPNTWRDATRNVIAAANAVSIQVNIDLHTWYTTWRTRFDSTVSGYATYRTQYQGFLNDAIPKLIVPGAKAFMVLNEPDWQTASDSDNTFICDCVTIAQSLTTLPISVRFMAGASPWDDNPHYSANIGSLCDFWCINCYWDPRNPGGSVNSSGSWDLYSALSQAHVAGKELWVTECGVHKDNTLDQANYIASWGTFMFFSTIRPADKIFAWVSKPNSTAEVYNIFDGTWNPYSVWYNLVSV